MIKIECYEAKTAQCGSDYFNGGRGCAMEYKVEHFYTEEEAQRACATERAKVAKEMAWCDWWVKKYITDEHYTVARVVVTVQGKRLRHKA